MMKVTLVIEYDDTAVAAQRLADTVAEVPGVESVEVTEWTS